VNAAPFEFTVFPVNAGTKVPAITGWQNIPYGESRGTIVQEGRLATRGSHLLVIDVDRPERWADSATGRLIGSQRTTVNPGNGHFHVYVDARGWSGPWPGKFKAVWGDAIGNGYVRGLPAYKWAEGSVMLPMSEQILAAIEADRVAVAGHGGGGRVMHACCADTSAPRWWEKLDDESLPHFYDLWALAGDMRNAGCEHDGYLEEFERLARAETTPWAIDDAERFWPEKWTPAATYQAANDFLAEMKATLPGTPSGAPQSAPQTAGSRIKRRKASAVAMRRVEWLWGPYVPRGFITLLAGMEKSGKTQIACELAARVTRDGHAVIMVCTEDPADSMTVPRLVAAGANLDLCELLEAGEESGGISIKTDLDEIGAVVAETGAKLVIIDPIVDVLSDETDNDKFADVGRELARLSAWADRTGVAVLALAHLRKASDGVALNKVLGSKAFTTKPRSVLQTFTHPEDGDMRLLAHTACNVGAQGVTLGYKIVGDVVQSPDGELPTSRVEWCGALEMFSADVLAATHARPVGRPSKVVECAEWVRSYLDRRGGYALITEVRAAAMSAGYGRDMLGSAELKTLGRFKADADYGKPTVHYWILLDAAPPPLTVFSAWRGEHKIPSAEQQAIIAKLEGDSL
jgi:AAA domain